MFQVAHTELCDVFCTLVRCLPKLPVCVQSMNLDYLTFRVAEGVLEGFNLWCVTSRHRLT